MILNEMRIDLQLLREGKYKPAPLKPETVKNNEEYKEFWKKIAVEIAKSGTEKVNLIKTLKNLSYLKELEEKETNLIKKMITNVKTETAENHELEKYTVYQIINDPENPLTTIALLTYIRRKLVTSSDDGVVFIVHNVS